MFDELECSRKIPRINTIHSALRFFRASFYEAVCLATTAARDTTQARMPPDVSIAPMSSQIGVAAKKCETRRETVVQIKMQYQLLEVT